MEDKNLPILDQNTYVKETALALWENLPKVMLYGFLFSLVSLPAFLMMLFGFVIPGILLGIFTIGPGWTALCTVIAQIILREPFTALSFFKAFGHFYRRSLVLAAFFALPFISAAWSLPSLATPPVPTVVWVGLGADLAGFFFLTSLYIYAYPILVLHDVSIRTALRNSLLLAIRYLGNTLGLIALAGLASILIFRVHVLFLAILPAAWLVFVINNTRMVLRFELGDPAEKPDGNGDAPS